ncbi:MAG: THUMP domain-containing protein [Thermoplasmata archaeon]|jgi:thiamine biosynthesis protein ThiI
MVDTILIRYGELALKSPPVRREFERQLQHNILEQFRAAGISGRLRSDAGHLYADVEDGARAIPALRRVFGITSVSRVEEIPADRAVLEERFLALADRRLRAGDRFAVRARRTGHHSFTSQELARDLGSAVLARFGDRGLSVDLDSPTVELFVEVRSNRAYLSEDRSDGPGGLPLGVAGRVVALVDGVRGALGAYLLMKRGCRTRWVTRSGGAELVASTLARFDPTGRTFPGDDGEEPLARQIADIADGAKADGIVLPLGVDGFPRARAVYGDRVVFSPTIGWTDREVEARWARVRELAG